MKALGFFLYAAFGFVLGGVLFSYHLPKLLKGIDVRAVSADHNPGTVNAFHYAGVPVGVLCLLCDLAKGFVPVFLAMRVLDFYNPWFALVILAPVLGHATAPLYHGQGGKAIAASFGVLLGLLPVSFLVFLLAALYLFFSLIWVIRPHERRTVVTFCLFAAFSVLAALHTGLWSFSLGSSLLSATVIVKNLRDARIDPLRPAVGREAKSEEPKVEKQRL